MDYFFEFSAEYVALCGATPGSVINPMTGQPETIDECGMMPGLCRNGACVDTKTGFRCDCYRGFIYDEASHSCIGKN